MGAFDWLSRRWRVVVAGGLTGLLLGTVVNMLMSPEKKVRSNGAQKPGNLTIEEPNVLAFDGVQGGSFTPPKIDLTLKAVGPGFHWALDGPVSDWFNLSPTQGDLAENGSIGVSIVLTPDAKKAAAGRLSSDYHVQIFRRKNDIPTFNTVRRACIG
jgi:hypothetical protein